MKKIIYVLGVFLFGLTGLYFGSGSIERVDIQQDIDLLNQKRDSLSKDTLKPFINYRTVPCTTKFDLKQAIALQNLTIYPIIQKASDFQATMIASASFGLLGSVISLLLSIVFKKTRLVDLDIWAICFLGALTGLVVVAIVYLLPTLLIKGDGNARPFSLMFVALFSGIYYKEFYEFLYKSVISKMFKNEKENDH